jgi:hypothetical protein
MLPARIPDNNNQSSDSSHLPAPAKARNRSFRCVASVTVLLYLFNCRTAVALVKVSSESFAYDLVGTMSNEHTHLDRIRRAVFGLGLPILLSNVALA